MQNRLQYEFIFPFSIVNKVHNFTRFTLSELSQVVELQRVALNAAENQTAASVIQNTINGLGIGSTIMSLVFANKTAVGVAAGLYSIISLGLGGTDYFKNGLRSGLNKTLSHFTWFAQNTSRYKRIEVELAFVEYQSGGERTRYIIGAGPITGMQSLDGSWVRAS